MASISFLQDPIDLFPNLSKGLVNFEQKTDGRFMLQVTPHYNSNVVQGKNKLQYN